jgi:hypothetical protein
LSGDDVLGRWAFQGQLATADVERFVLSVELDVSCQVDLVCELLDLDRCLVFERLCYVPVPQLLNHLLLIVDVQIHVHHLFSQSCHSLPQLYLCFESKRFNFLQHLIDELHVGFVLDQIEWNVIRNAFRFEGEMRNDRSAVL